MSGREFILAWLGAGLAAAQPAILPLADIRPGMKGVGRSVFAGGTVEEFPVEILGVLENSGPRQSIILARLGGAAIERSGVLQGMSGSPVYIDGRLAGAVALSFPYSKDPVAGIRPIEEMLRSAESPPALRAARLEPGAWDYASALPRPIEVAAGGARLVEIATPLWFSGFARSVVDHFAPALRAAGLEPVQGVSGGGRPAPMAAKPARLEPGSMISVQLITGDLASGADGTVTCLDGEKIYAFGHRFLSVGATEMPFARSEVLTLLASVQTSFKITSPKEWMGAILQDRTAAISGEIGRPARLTPVRLAVQRGGALHREYRMQMVQDRLLTPLLLQMAVYSSLEATERTAGAATIRARGRVKLDGVAESVAIDSIYSGDLGAPQLISAAAAAPAAYLLQSGFAGLRLASIDLTLEVSDDKQQYRIDSLTASRRSVRPGDFLDVLVSLSGDGGAAADRVLRYRIPPGEPAGTLYITAADASTANLSDYRAFFTASPRGLPQLLDFLNGIKTATKAYVRVWRAHPSFTAQTDTLPDPPPSVALLLGRTQTPTTGSRVAEMEVDLGGAMITGSKTIALEVKP
jgi:hypothetical protein